MGGVFPGTTFQYYRVTHTRGSASGDGRLWYNVNGGSWISLVSYAGYNQFTLGPFTNGDVLAFACQSPGWGPFADSNSNRCVFTEQIPNERWLLAWEDFSDFDYNDFYTLVEAIYPQTNYSRSLSDNLAGGYDTLTAELGLYDSRKVMYWAYGYDSATSSGLYSTPVWWQGADVFAEGMSSDNTVTSSLPGVRTYHGQIGHAIGGLACHPTTDVLYGVTTDYDSTAPNSLLKINRRNGQSRVIGSLGRTCADITFLPNGTLFGVCWDSSNSPLGEEEAHPYTINLETGSATEMPWGTYNGTGGSYTSRGAGCFYSRIDGFVYVLLGDTVWQVDPLTGKSLEVDEPDVAILPRNSIRPTLAIDMDFQNRVYGLWDIPEDGSDTHFMKLTSWWDVNLFPIIGVSVANKTFTVAGDYTDQFTPSTIFGVEGNTPNAQDLNVYNSYVVAESTYADGETTVLCDPAGGGPVLTPAVPVEDVTGGFLTLPAEDTVDTGYFGEIGPACDAMAFGYLFSPIVRL